VFPEEVAVRAVDFVANTLLFSEAGTGMVELAIGSGAAGGVRAQGVTGRVREAAVTGPARFLVRARGTVGEPLDLTRAVAMGASIDIAARVIAIVVHQFAAAMILARRPLGALAPLGDALRVAEVRAPVVAVDIAALGVALAVQLVIRGAVAGPGRVAAKGVGGSDLKLGRH
jgi:hypothetical protein